MEPAPSGLPALRTDSVSGHDDGVTIHAGPTSVPAQPAAGVSVRPADAGDGPGLSALYASLSPDSRRRRFLRAFSSPVELSTITSGHDLVAVLREAGPRDGEIVGHAALHLLDTSSAEIAFVVADEFQGRGIGTALMREAIDAARRLRLVRLEATTLADNAAMRRLLLHAGCAVARDEMDFGVEEIAILIGAAPPAAPER